MGGSDRAATLQMIRALGVVEKVHLLAWDRRAGVHSVNAFVRSRSTVIGTSVYWRQLLVLHQSESHEDVLIPRKSRGQSRYDLLPRTQHEWIPRQGHSGTCSNRCVWIPQVDTGSERCVRIGGNKKSDPKVVVISEEGQFSWIRTRVGPSLLFVIDALLGPHQVADPPAIELTKVPA